MRTTRSTASFENGDYVRVQGTSQFYNGAMQMIVSRIDRVIARDVDETDFVTLNVSEIDRLAAHVGEMLRSVRSEPLRNLAECFLMDEAFMAAFTTAPAGIKNHHAYRGGLLEHVHSLMRLVSNVASHYRDLDPDLMVMGAFSARRRQDPRIGVRTGLGLQRRRPTDRAPGDRRRDAR
jgi:3'-5' exoribonuclease